MRAALTLATDFDIVSLMKAEIHPEYHPKAQITCSCGHVLEVGSTLAEVKVDICSNCHPFYTGKQKQAEKGGRIERFQERLAKAAAPAKGKKEA